MRRLWHKLVGHPKWALQYGHAVDAYWCRLCRSIVR